MRYIWDQYQPYLRSAGFTARHVFPNVAHRLRQWDVTSAARVDRIVANSNHVAARVKSYWRRDATVVHPPVAIEKFAPVAQSEIGDFYLWLGELAPYKRPELALEAFRILDRPLIVIGGPSNRIKELAKLAGPNTKFLGRVSEAEMKGYLSRCRALVFPGEEDFGIVPVEAMASGRPVIAYGRGGVLDTVTHDATGLFFHEQNADSLVDAILEFERSDLDHAAARACVQRSKLFSEQAFQIGLRENLMALGVENLPAMHAQRAQA